MLSAVYSLPAPLSTHIVDHNVDAAKALSRAFNGLLHPLCIANVELDCKTFAARPSPIANLVNLFDRRVNRPRQLRVWFRRLCCHGNVCALTSEVPGNLEADAARCTRAVPPLSVYWRTLADWPLLT